MRSLISLNRKKKTLATLKYRRIPIRNKIISKTIRLDDGFFFFSETKMRQKKRNKPLTN